jgi:hypothetical protein
VTEHRKKRENVLKKEKKKKRRGWKRKAARVSANKGEVNIIRGENASTSKSSFWCNSIYSPSIIPFQKPLPKSLRKFS